MKQPHIALDTETYAFTHGCIAPRLVCLTMTRDGRTPEIYLHKEAEDVAEWMLDSTVPVVAHNGAFDWATIGANYPRLLPKIFEQYEEAHLKCTLIREALYILAMGQLQDDRSRSMLSLNETYFRRMGRWLEGKKDGPDSIRLNFHKLDGVPINQWPADAVEYATKDAIVASQIFVQQEDMPDEERQTASAFALYLMACTGIRANATKTAFLRRTLEERIARMTQLLIPAGLVRPSEKRNVTAIRNEVARQYTAWGKPVPLVVPKGRKKREAAEGQPKKAPNVSFSAEYLIDLPCQGSVECDAEKFLVCDNPLHQLAARTEDAGEISKYVQHLEHACRAPINYSVTSLVSTGRTAISKPPLQQMPTRPGVRQCIEPPDGWWFIGADFSSIELTTLGQILLDMFGESLLAQTIQEGKDPHAVTAAFLMGIEYEEAMRLKEREDDYFDLMRNLSKALDFGAPGGMGGEAFVGYAKGYGYKYTGTPEEQVEQARKHIRQFKSLYPEIKRYMDYVSQQCDEGGGFFDLRQPRSGRIRGQVQYTNGCNSPFQGLAADLAKDAHWHITKEMFVRQTPASPLFGCRSVLFMHDEFISMAPMEIAAEAAERQSQLMLEAARRWCPDVPTKAEPWITRCWEKKAKTVRDANGRLIPWEPKKKVAA